MVMSVLFQSLFPGDSEILVCKKKVKRWETSLDGTGSNHLLLQVLLVLADAAIPAGDGLVLAHHDVLGDLVEESGRKCVSTWIF
jgi:hypothetical protein